MTDELNELASAYVDGETTPDESARVENDTQAQITVDKIRRLSSRINSVAPQQDEVRENHIAAALAAFDAAASDKTIVVDKPDPDATQKIDLRSNNPAPLRAVPNEPQDQAPTSNGGYSDPNIAGLVGNVVPISPKPSYRWLAPLAGAAAFVLVLGAGFTIASQDTFTSSSDEASSVAVATTDSAVAAEARQVEQQAGSASASDAADTDADDQAESAADFADEDAAEVEEESAPAESPAPADNELLSFDVLPDDAELEMIGSNTELSTDFQFSSCATGANDPSGGELLGYLPIMVGGERGELLVFSSETGRRGVSVSAVDNQCQLLPQG